MMENSIQYKNLDKYWQKCGKKEKYSERLAVKFSCAFNNEKQWKEIFILDVLRGCQMFFCSIFSLGFEQLENCLRRRRLSRLLNFQKEEIAVDVNDLLEHKEKIRCLGNDFTYSVVTSKEYLKNIEVIFGDAHLEALDDIACFGNLKKVTGGIYYKGRKYEDLVEL